MSLFTAVVCIVTTVIESAFWRLPAICDLSLISLWSSHCYQALPQLARFEGSGRIKWGIHAICVAHPCLRHLYFLEHVVSCNYYFISRNYILFIVSVLPLCGPTEVLFPICLLQLVSSIFNFYLPDLYLRPSSWVCSDADLRITTSVYSPLLFCCCWPN